VLSRFFEFLYPKVFVNITALQSKSVVFVEVVENNGSIIQSVEESFDTVDINEKMYDFISLYAAESPFCYISVFGNLASQGAVGGCLKSQIAEQFDMPSSNYLCYDKKWTFYAPKSDVHLLKKRYSRVGVDFIFSPFVVLANFFKDKTDADIAMFVLIEESYITLCIFKKSELLYAKYLDVEYTNDSEELLIQDSDSEEEIELALDDEIDLEDVDVDEFDNLGDIEDLDSSDDLDEFSDTKDIEEEFEENLNENFEEKTPVKEADSFSEDYQRFLLIQDFMSDFYKDDRYPSDFIESVYMADSTGTSGDLKRYLEEEMFLNVYVRNIDLNAEICELAKAELK